MPTSPPTITAAGAVPDPSDRATYNSRAYAFMQWMKNAVAEFTAVATNVYNNAVESFTNATTASSAAASAIAAAGATAWVSGTTYSAGACTWSPSTRQTYRRNSAGAGTTDPAIDSANWTQISGASLSLVVVTATTVTAQAGQHLALTNVAASTATLPPSPASGDTVWVTPCNGLGTNVLARNGSNIMGLAEDMTLDDPNLTYPVRYINSTQGWRLI